MNTPVNFEIAKLLKEKGFNLKVRYSYGHSINPHIAYPNEDFAISCDFNSPNMGRNWKHLYSAPTIAEVIMWLYEKHGIWIEIGVGNLFHKDKFYVIIKQHNVDRWDLTPLNNEKHSPYDTPTEAYEAAIEYALKELI
jgi:hypothetical protein